MRRSGKDSSSFCPSGLGDESKYVPKGSPQGLSKEGGVEFRPEQAMEEEGLGGARGLVVTDQRSGVESVGVTFGCKPQVCGEVAVASPWGVLGFDFFKSIVAWLAEHMNSSYTRFAPRGAEECWEIVPFSSPLGESGVASAALQHLSGCSGEVVVASVEEVLLIEWSGESSSQVGEERGVETYQGGSELDGGDSFDDQVEEEEPQYSRTKRRLCCKVATPVRRSSKLASMVSGEVSSFEVLKSSKSKFKGSRLSGKGVRRQLAACRRLGGKVDKVMELASWLDLSYHGMEEEMRAKIEEEGDDDQES